MSNKNNLSNSLLEKFFKEKEKYNSLKDKLTGIDDKISYYSFIESGKRAVNRNNGILQVNKNQAQFNKTPLMRTPLTQRTNIQFNENKNYENFREYTNYEPLHSIFENSNSTYHVKTNLKNPVNKERYFYSTLETSSGPSKQSILKLNAYQNLRIKITNKLIESTDRLMMIFLEIIGSM